MRSLVGPALLFAQNPESRLRPERSHASSARATPTGEARPSRAAPAPAADRRPDQAAIMKPLSDEWTSYSGDLTGKRYSALKLVNTDQRQEPEPQVDHAAQLRGAVRTARAPVGRRRPRGGGWRWRGGRGGGGGGPNYPIVVGGLGQRRREHVRPGAHRRRHSGGRTACSTRLSPNNVFAIDARDGAVALAQLLEDRAAARPPARAAPACWAT